MPPSRPSHHSRGTSLLPWSAEAEYRVYQVRAQQRRQRQHQQRQARAAATQTRVAKLPPELQHWIEIDRLHAAIRRKTSHERLKYGFRWAGGTINGRYLPAFVAHRLRSELHALLRLFVAGTPRAETSLCAGNAKERLDSRGSKLALLDRAYVSFSCNMRSILRIDLDSTFASWEALRVAIEAAGLPAPNLAVACVDAESRVEHPHAYWLLANAVCCTSHGRSRPQRLLRGLERAMVAALIPIGADPGGLANPYTGKNPLSELWDCQVLSAMPFNLTNGPGAQPGLPALADYMRPRFTSLEPAVPADEPDVTGALQQSNGAFYVLRAHSGKHVARFHPRGRGEGRRDEFIAGVVAYARSQAAHCRLSAWDLEKTARTTAAYAWDHFDPLRRRSHRPQRGRCQAQCAGQDLRARQQIGGRDVAARRRAATLTHLVDAYDRLIQTGTVAPGELPANRLLAAEAGITIRTLQKCRAAFQAVLRARGERRCPDKELAFLPALSGGERSAAGEHPAPLPAFSQNKNIYIYITLKRM